MESKTVADAFREGELAARELPANEFQREVLRKLASKDARLAFLEGDALKRAYWLGARRGYSR